VDVGLRNGSEEGNIIMAFADLNNDKYTDVVTIGDSKSSFTAHIYDSAKKMFAY